MVSVVRLVRNCERLRGAPAASHGIEVETHCLWPTQRRCPEKPRQPRSPSGRERRSRCRRLPLQFQSGCPTCGSRPHIPNIHPSPARYQQNKRHKLFLRMKSHQAPLIRVIGLPDWSARRSMSSLPHRPPAAGGDSAAPALAGYFPMTIPAMPAAVIDALSSLAARFRACPSCALPAIKRRSWCSNPLPLPFLSPSNPPPGTQLPSRIAQITVFSPLSPIDSIPILRDRPQSRGSVQRRLSPLLWSDVRLRSGSVPRKTEMRTYAFTAQKGAPIRPGINHIPQ